MVLKVKITKMQIRNKTKNNGQIEDTKKFTTKCEKVYDKITTLVYMQFLRQLRFMNNYLFEILQ